LIKIKSLRSYYLEFPLINPVITSFGVMKTRPCIIVELEDFNQNIGYGEIWCNFPSDGASYRFNLLNSLYLDNIIGLKFSNPDKLIDKITDKFKTLFIQSGDIGSFDNINSGLDCAFWDLFAKTKKIPLNKLLNADSPKHISVYASGINPSDSYEKIEVARSMGIKAFKVKIGFNHSLDIDLLRSLDDYVASDEMLMLDANQGWSIEEASKYLKILENYNFSWIEEPISALSNKDEFNNIINSTNCNLAFGENINNLDDFIFLGQNNKLKYIQPDLTKYGGISLISNLSKTIQSNKIWMHFLGGGVGLLTSAHIMSVINPSAFLETDINVNPLRTNLLKNELKIEGGKINFNDEHGIGGPLDFDTINKYLISSNI
jgi:D-galactarolactone cycloisomerase|tara:strand:+ start:1479 stop:2603 length:1125 start_codon:yes stop_codon:yes gene_type:complete